LSFDLESYISNFKCDVFSRMF